MTRGQRAFHHRLWLVLAPALLLALAVAVWSR
jgi:hypothetical protein